MESEQNVRVSTPVVPSTTSARNWCFTLNYGRSMQPDREDALAQIMKLNQDLCTYLVAGDEKAPTTGQQHFQGYAQLAAKQRLSALKKLMPTAHFEVARGDDEANKEYCSKEGEFVEYGTRRDTSGGSQGGAAEKERWKKARRCAESGDLTEVDDQIFVSHYSSLRAIAKDSIVMPPDTDGCTGIWIWGPSGVGKSRRAREIAPGAYKKLANKWFDGYNPRVHKEVILDDFDKVHNVLAYHIKIWADRYAFLGETKGGALALRPELLIITSNYAPEDIWQDERDLEPIRRRFKVFHMANAFPQIKQPSSLNLSTRVKSIASPGLVWCENKIQSDSTFVHPNVEADTVTKTQSSAVTTSNQLDCVDLTSPLIGIDSQSSDESSLPRPSTPMAMKLTT